MRSHLFNAVMLLFGALVCALMAMVFVKGLRDDPAPFGQTTSTDPVLAGPYGQNSPDRWTANELHALNKHVEKLLSLLEEMKGRMGE